MPLILDRECVRAVFTVEAAIEAAEVAFTALARGLATMPQRLATRVEEHAGTHLSMPCYVNAEGAEALCIKVVTVFERNMPDFGLPTTLAFLALHDPRTGELLALMDAEYLTVRRTAASSALATDRLAPPEAHTLAIFGSGAQAAGHVEAMLAVRPVERVLVVSPDPRAPAFCEEMTGRFGVPVVHEPDPGRVASEAQILGATTNSTTPVFPGHALRPGAHINAIGSFRPDMRELDGETVRRSTVYVDRREAAQNGAGDLMQAADEGTLDWTTVRELGALLIGEAPGRQTPDEITLYKSVGVAVQDATAAATVYRAASERGLGMPFALH